jgi:hypothetical protein
MIKELPPEGKQWPTARREKSMKDAGASPVNNSEMTKNVALVYSGYYVPPPSARPRLFYLARVTRLGEDLSALS